MITTSQHNKYLHTKANVVCMWCGEKTFLWWEIDNDEFLIWSPLRQATLEHIVPRSLGGNNLDVNGGRACVECNTCRKNISYNSFKYLTANKDRYMKWKNNRPVSKKVSKKIDKQFLVIKEGGDRISHKGVREWLHIIDLKRLQPSHTSFPEAQTKWQ